MGVILLAGGAEFRGQMAIPDRRAIELAGGLSARIRIIPAAAAPDGNHRRAGENGARWFRSLGASEVESLPLVDRASAEDPGIAEDLRRSRLIYILGGFPQYLAETLAGSAAWTAVRQAGQSGAVIAGSSAGAMVLCDHYYAPSAKTVFSGLGLVSATCFLPHHDTFGHRWAQRLVSLLPSALMIGVDEETGILNDGAEEKWTVYGKGFATVYHGGRTRRFASGKIFTFTP